MYTARAYKVASHADVLRGSSRVPALRTSAEFESCVKTRVPVFRDYFSIFKIWFS